MSRLLCAVATAMLLTLPTWSAAASPQLFKCVEGGRTVYQQQACPVTSQVEPAASGPASMTKVASEPATRVAARLRPVPASAASAPATPR